MVYAKIFNEGAVNVSALSVSVSTTFGEIREKFGNNGPYFDVKQISMYLIYLCTANPSGMETIT